MGTWLLATSVVVAATFPGYRSFCWKAKLNRCGKVFVRFQIAVVIHFAPAGICRNVNHAICCSSVSGISQAFSRLFNDFSRDDFGLGCVQAEAHNARGLGAILYSDQ